MTGAYLSIYGKTISIIGSFDDTALAKEAVGMLIDGAAMPLFIVCWKRSGPSKETLPGAEKYPEPEFFLVTKSVDTLRE